MQFCVFQSMLVISSFKHPMYTHLFQDSLTINGLKITLFIRLFSLNLQQQKKKKTTNLLFVKEKITSKKKKKKLSPARNTEPTIAENLHGFIFPLILNPLLICDHKPIAQIRPKCFRWVIQHEMYNSIPQTLHFAKLPMCEVHC